MIRSCFKKPLAAVTGSKVHQFFPQQCGVIHSQTHTERMDADEEIIDIGSDEEKQELQRLALR